MLPFIHTKNTQNTCPPLILNPTHLRVTLAVTEKMVELVFKERRVLREMLALWEPEDCL